MSTTPIAVHDSIEQVGIIQWHPTFEQYVCVWHGHRVGYVDTREQARILVERYNTGELQVEVFETSVI